MRREEFKGTIEILIDLLGEMQLPQDPRAGLGDRAARLRVRECRQLGVTMI